MVPKGFFPAAGHRPDLRHHRCRAGHFLRRHGQAPEPGGAKSSWRSRRWTPSARSSAAATAVPPSTTAACSSPSSRSANARSAPRRSSTGSGVRLAGIAGHQALSCKPSQDIRVGGRSPKAQYQYALQCGNLDELNHWSAEAGEQTAQHSAIARMSTATSKPAACRPTSSWTATPPPASASPPSTIDNTLYDAFGQRQVSTIYER